MASLLPTDRATVFLALMSMEGRSFTSTDAMEAVQHSRDLPSALKFLSHCCPICQEQMSFSKARNHVVTDLRSADHTGDITDLLLLFDYRSSP